MTDRPPPLQWLIDRLRRLVRAATDTLAQGGNLTDWRATITRLLTRYSAAAMQAGQGGAPLNDQAKATVARQVQAQIGFLDGFAAEIQDAKAFAPGWNARAAMYAESISAPYWAGRTQLLPLPALPGDGTTQCKSRCRCSWDVQQVEGDGNYDAYWRMGAADHCQTCKQRAADWAPVRIRNGELQ